MLPRVCAVGVLSALYKLAIRESTGFQDVVVRIVDVASYSSVIDFCKTIEREESRLDVCMYNAGIIATKFKATADGNEEW